MICSECGQSFDPEEPDQEVCLECLLDLAWDVSDELFTPGGEIVNSTSAKPRNDGNDQNCAHCGKRFWLHPLAVAIVCPHCGKPLLVMQPKRPQGVVR